MKVSRTSPVMVPAGTLVIAVAALADSKVVAVPTWVTVAVVVAVVARCGTAPMPAATMMMPIDAPITLSQKRECAGWPRRASLLRRRGPVPGVLLDRLEPPPGPSLRCAAMSISLSALDTAST
jgi:hypothetical protein